MPSIRLIWVALVAVITMSAVPVLVKSSAANELTIGIARLALALLVISPVMIWRKQFSSLTKKDYAGLFAIGLVFAVHWLTYFASIKLATAVIASMAMATYSVQFLLLAWWVNKEPIRPLELFAILMSFAGCVVVTPSFSLSNDVTLGIAIGVFSGFLYGCLPLLHQRVQHMNTLQRTWGQFSFALLCYIPLIGWSDWNLPSTDWSKLVMLGLLCTVISHGLWVKASTELPAVFTGIIYYLYVPSAMLSSAYFLEEEITIQKMIGASLIILSSCFVVYYRWQLNRKTLKNYD